MTLRYMLITSVWSVPKYVLLYSFNNIKTKLCVKFFDVCCIQATTWRPDTPNEQPFLTILRNYAFITPMEKPQFNVHNSVSTPPTMNGPLIHMRSSHSTAANRKPCVCIHRLMPTLKHTRRHGELIHTEACNLYLECANYAQAAALSAYLFACRIWLAGGFPFASDKTAMTRRANHPYVYFIHSCGPQNSY